MWSEKEPRVQVTFSYRTFDDDGNQTAYIERNMHDDKAECLTDLLREFHYFLLAMTYTYVDGVTAYDQHGEDVATSA